MYEIRSGIKSINDQYIDTFERDIEVGNTCMEVEAGTNGLKGGGREKGSRTYLRLERISGADFHVRTEDEDNGQSKTVEIMFSGDEGLVAMLEALSFSFKAIVDFQRDFQDE